MKFQNGCIGWKLKRWADRCRSLLWVERLNCWVMAGAFFVMTTISTGKGFADSNITLELMYQKHQSYGRGERTDLQEMYQTISGKYSLESFWGQWATLGLVRWYLAGTGTANPQAAQETMDLLPNVLIHKAFIDQHALWQYVIDLHREADRTLESNAHTPSFEFLGNRPSLRIFDGSHADLQWSIALIGRRFELARQSERGGVYFQRLVQEVENSILQSACLKSLAELRLASGDYAGAKTAARSYWLLSVEHPHQLPSAIDLMVTVMELGGMNQNDLKKFRRQQMSGEKDNGAVVAIFSLNQLAGNSDYLFSNDQISLQGEIVYRARMHLLNGDLKSAVPILQELLSLSSQSMEQREQVLRLVRMAFALNDGHMHRIGRYDHYLSRIASGSPIQDPTEELFQVSKERLGNAR